MPIPKEPGQSVSARVSWKNGGHLSFAPLMRVDVGVGDAPNIYWLLGDWMPSPLVAAGDTAILTVVSPPVIEAWTGKLVHARVKAWVNRVERLLNEQIGLFAVPSPGLPPPAEYTSFDVDTGYFFYIEFGIWPSPDIIHYFDPATGETWSEIY